MITPPIKLPASIATPAVSKLYGSLQMGLYEKFSKCKILVCVRDGSQIDNLIGQVFPCTQMIAVDEINSLEDAHRHSAATYSAVIFAGDPPAAEIVQYLMSRVRRTK